MYHNQAILRAQNPTNLQERMADVARRLLQHGGYNTAMRQFLRDCARGRYEFKSLSHLVKASAQCGDGATTLALAEEVRGLIIAHIGTPAMAIADAIDRETIANHRENVAELRFFQQRTPARRDELEHELVGQIEASRVALDVLHATHIAPTLSVVR